MRALWLENQNLELRGDVPIPVPGQDGALIKLRLAGVCATDLELLRGYYPFKGIPGHEFVGDVVSAPGDPALVGRRVVGEINIGCGVCPACKSGLSRHCERRKTLGIQGWDGAFAEYLMLPMANLHEIPAALPDEVAVFTEPMAAAGEILEQVKLGVADRVLIIGAGRLGQLIAQVLQTTGCQLMVVARYQKQRDILSSHHIWTVLEDGLGEDKYDFVIEASGSPDGFALAQKAVRPRGTIVLKSTYAGNLELDMSAIVVDEVRLIGSRCGLFEPALKWLVAGQVDPRPLVEAYYHLEQGLAAFEHAARPGALKVLLKV